MAANKSKDKGARAEVALKKVLIEATGLDWQRTPGSGAMNPRYKLKGDLYIPNEKNIYLIECKHYKEDQLGSKVLVNRDPVIFNWWEKAVRQGEEVGMKPLVIYKWDRSKWYVITKEELNIVPSITIQLSSTYGYIYPLEKFLKEDIRWL